MNVWMYDIFKLIFLWNTDQHLSSNLKEKRISLTIYPLKMGIIKTYSTCDTNVDPYNIVTNFGVVKTLPKCRCFQTYLPVNIHHSKVWYTHAVLNVSMLLSFHRISSLIFLTTTKIIYCMVYTYIYGIPSLYKTV